eukprot:2319642-Karenia_brevis.AAC.1
MKLAQMMKKDVTLVTLSNLDGLFSQAQSTCMKRCALPGLLLIVCCRLTPFMALVTGMQYYPSAVSYSPSLLKQGPLPSIQACFNREEKLQHAPAWGFLLPPGPRDDD